MAGTSTIEWTELTWNPVTGCTKISAGCKYCYAERMAKRLQAMGVEQYRNGFAVTLAPAALEQPHRWTGRRLVFVNSMSDLFHEQVPEKYIARVFSIMNETPQHTYQILTKRSARLADLSSRLRWTPNIWMGVSVEDVRVVGRIEDLRRSHALVKFLSVEPLIGPTGRLNLVGIDWVIVGGESGPGARPMLKDWVDCVYADCHRQHVRFFFKQWGSKRFNPDREDPTIEKAHPQHAKGGCQLDGAVHRDMPIRAPLEPALQLTL